MHRFLFPESLEGISEVTLSAEESHHLAKVVRVREDEEIVLVNGRGAVAVARVLESSARASKVRILSVRQETKRPAVHLAFAIPKGAAFDFIVRRSTELGVGSLQPLVTRYSLRPHSFNDMRWQKVVVEVSKQCEEVYFPEVLPPLPLEEWLRARASARPLVFCHENERETENDIPEAREGIDLLIGSEGGWADEETEKGLACGVIPFGLGKNRLRAETATLVALTLLKHRIGEL
jgi:16S rRNA (uracil1498-N3)-methyltransferase